MYKIQNRLAQKRTPRKC